MFDVKFCCGLEQAISLAVRESVNPELAGFWCDGVLIDAAPAKGNVHQPIEGFAFIGTTGQDRYHLMLYPGPKAVSRRAHGLALTPCIPSPDHPDWIYIDPDAKRIEVWLLRAVPAPARGIAADILFCVASIFNQRRDLSNPAGFDRSFASLTSGGNAEKIAAQSPAPGQWA